MILQKETAQKTAQLLLQIKAIKLQPQNPFIWASGWQSPIYCDNRITLSYPEIRNYLRENIAKQIADRFGKPDAIVGVATGAIGIGMLVADYLNLPFCYVRPQAKKHGRQNQIEGHLEKGQSVVVIEDLISTGKSSLQAVEALREHQVKIKGMFAIFTYGFQLAEDNFAAHNIDLFTLSDYHHLIHEAEKLGYCQPDELTLLQQWRENPAVWETNKTT
jgi:orotate phosphoribosyltransferase